MAEPTVQVPVSLIERAMTALMEVPPSSRYAEIYSDLSALLLEPTLTKQQVRSLILDNSATQLALEQRGSDSLRVQEMPPGMEFLCQGKGVPGVEHHMRVTEETRSDGTRILWCLTHDSDAEAYIDPSTIRDVTPPKEQS